MKNSTKKKGLKLKKSRIAPKVEEKMNINDANTFDEFLTSLNDDVSDVESDTDDELGEKNEAQAYTDEGNANRGEGEYQDVKVEPASEDSDSDDEKIVKSHKETIKNLESIDPEFFAYLKEHDAQLLSLDDSEDDDSDEEDPIHKPPAEMEEASDSEAEEAQVFGEESESSLHQKAAGYLKKRIVNLYVISYWEEKLQNTRDLGVFSNVVDAFESAVETLLEGKNAQGSSWKVVGATNFNALVRMCIKQVKGFCLRFLFASNNEKLAESRFDLKPLESQEKNKNKWIRLRKKIRLYMLSIAKFIRSMGNSDAICTMLRHCMKMAGFWACLGSKSIKLIKALDMIWSQGDHAARVLAFITLIKVTHYNRQVFLLYVMKMMYISYVANCKFTSVSSWPDINFMRRSLVELYLLDYRLAYSLGFPFVRQLAIHLRNAVKSGGAATTKNQKDATKIVYSWQFLHSLHLWCDVLAEAGNRQCKEDESVMLLLVPVVEVGLGTIKLLPTKRYAPLRFHIIKMLTKVMEKTEKYVPLFPAILKALDDLDLSSKAVSKFSVRPIDFDICLRSDPSESGHAAAVIQHALECILRLGKILSTQLSSPEIFIFVTIELRKFLKNCKNPEISKKVKTLIDKIEANSEFVKKKRDTALDETTVSLIDRRSHKLFEAQLAASTPPPPLLAYAREWLADLNRVKSRNKKAKFETKEEQLIPKPSEANKLKNREKKAIKLGKKMFAGSESESDEETVHTKLDEEVPGTKRKLVQKKQVGREAKKKNRKKLNLSESADIPDSVVPLDWSDED